jgi:glycosyltransferase involved in cell wall biosynthesis
VKVSVIIPAYNEIATIAEILRRVRQAPFEKEVVVVDDGSTDGTREYLESIQDREIQVLFHQRNQGKGTALRTGIVKATGDIVVIQDADLEYFPDEILQLTKKIEEGKADAVYGSRFIGARRAFLFYHYLGNKVVNLIANVLFNTNLTDLMTCYKAFRRDVIQSIRLSENRFAVEAEITGKLFKQGYRVYEIPISYDGRGYDEGKKIQWTDFFSVVASLMKVRMEPSEIGLETLERTKSLRRYNDWVFERIRPILGEEVIEIGAGAGNFSALMNRRKRLVVTEFNDYYLSRLAQRFNGHPFVSVKRCDLSYPVREQGFENTRFDTAICMNVLEHTEDDSLAVRNLHDLLRPGGRVFILVPAHGELFGTLDEALGHRRRYTNEGLRGLLEREDLRVEQISYFNPVAVLPWRLNGQLLRRKTISAFQAWLFDLLVPVFRRLSPREPTSGLSLIAVAKRG